MKSFRIAVASAVVVALAATTACAPGDKAGGDSIVLEFATIDGEVNGWDTMIGAETFVEALAEVSGGRMTAAVELNYGGGGPDSESDLVEAIASGEVDGGWPGARAFAAAGIPGLEPLEAPLTITSAAAQAALVTGDAARLAEATLDGTGVHSLGLLAGALRRPFTGTEPLVSLADWSEAPFRVWSSPIQAATVEALGGEPVPVGIDWQDRVASGSLHGADFDIAGYHAIGNIDKVGRLVTNVALYPKTMVLSINRARWDSLSEQQRGWLSDAAGRAVTAAAGFDFAADEDRHMASLCSRGVVFDVADDDQLAELQTAVDGLIDELRTEAASAELMAAVLSAAQAHPQPDAPQLPTDCAPAAGGIPATTAPIPDGIYRAENTQADQKAADSPDSSGNTGVWTLTVKGGEYALTCRPLDRPGIDCGHSDFTSAADYDTVLEAGFLKGDDDSVWIVYDAAVHDRLSGCGSSCHELPATPLEWSLDEGALTLTDQAGAVVTQWVISPWQRIG